MDVFYTANTDRWSILVYVFFYRHVENTVAKVDEKLRELTLGTSRAFGRVALQ